MSSFLDHINRFRIGYPGSINLFDRMRDSVGDNDSSPKIFIWIDFKPAYSIPGPQISTLIPTFGLRRDQDLVCNVDVSSKRLRAVNVLNKMSILVLQNSPGPCVF